MSEPPARERARWPVSVKAVIAGPKGTLLGRNDRDEWELLGGRLEPGEQPADAVVREVREEAGMAVLPRALLLAESFEVLPGRHVLVLAFGCVRVDGGAPVRSAEHREVRFVPDAELRALRLPAVYRRAIDASRG